MRNRRWVVVGAVVALGALSSGCTTPTDGDVEGASPSSASEASASTSPSGPPDSGSDSGSTSDSAAATSAGEEGGVAVALGSLVVEEEPAREGYDRDLFEHWITQPDGCSTRERVLIDEAVEAPEVGDGCAVGAGRWLSLYDEVELDRGRDLDIDHLVPLAEAWDSGASAWDAARREAFANDLDHPEALIAVSASSNRSKGDQDPAEWVPPDAGYHCTYARDWVAVKVAWDLRVDADEVEVLAQMLDTCDGP